MDIGSILNGGPEAKWFMVPDTEVRVQIRALKPHRRDQIIRQYTKTKLVRGTPMDRTDWRSVNHDWIDEGIISWENVEKDGQEFPCTRENKIALCDNWPEFYKLWYEVIRLQGEIDGEIEEGEGKN